MWLTILDEHRLIIINLHSESSLFMNPYALRCRPGVTTRSHESKPRFEVIEVESGAPQIGTSDIEPMGGR